MAVLIVLFVLGAALAVYSCKGLIIYWLEVAVSNAAGTRGKKNPWLEGSYAPVKQELLEADLPVQGKLPAALDGAYVRNGPNPLHQPIGGHHWFDGDGMLHAVRIKDGKASYSNAYVQTSKYKQEKKAGRPLFFTLGAMERLSGVLIYMLQQLKEKLGVVDTKDGHGPANTSVVFHNKQLLALVETDLPQVVRVNNDAHIETLERQTYGDQLRSPFTAHPKIDPETGELHGIGYSFSKPLMHYYVIGSGGTVKLDIDIPLPDPVMMHDFAITEDYAVFMDLPLMINQHDMIKGKPLVNFNEGRASRFGVLPKRCEDADKVRWSELPAMFAFHVANAWQEGNAIHLFACVYAEGFDFVNVSAGKDGSLPRLTEISLDLDSGKASMRTVADVHCEFPTIPDRLVGRKTRYTYVVTYKYGGGFDRPYGLAKIDLAASSPAAAVPAQIGFGRGRFGGEAVFVPRSTDPAALKSEDDGYLATYVYDEQTDSSEFMVYDACSFSAEPVARVKLPQRVPHGFHGKHINAAQFQAQFPFDIHFLPDI
ncbi:carotenoid cleavage dioxygenase 1B [Coccomyxa subellipsoidea C-169]|uniref:carotenoid 9,10-dioxygenase n=1 Tax=Coccomyxa subellipsoidea (strain C-169) TaxID=574566 RepID=I0YSH3_COCSC|nr:carotenoid cleavage dioxygenase 1B [Coccomyxa subellipsoidea C-169]EIE21342.1 carotenoid cleavage dioxygenase 1B [Coccomyxa subellipsoidea C-169]|eukprot:XP_005645886.1 carotenoid cleavage dioxygenase 1B [Coccomyxa subellipsoidea C-169]